MCLDDKTDERAYRTHGWAIQKREGAVLLTKAATTFATVATMAAINSTEFDLGRAEMVFPQRKERRTLARGGMK